MEEHFLLLLQAREDRPSSYDANPVPQPSDSAVAPILADSMMASASSQHMQLPLFFVPTGSDGGVVALHQLISDPSGALYCTPSRRLSMTPFVHRASTSPFQTSVAAGSIPAHFPASSAVVADAIVSTSVPAAAVSSVDASAVAPLSTSVVASSSSAVAAGAIVSTIVPAPAVSAVDASAVASSSTSVVASSSSAVAAGAIVPTSVRAAAVSAVDASCLVLPIVVNSQSSFDGYSLKDYVHLEVSRREKFWNTAPTAVKTRVREDLLSLPEQNKARVQALEKSWII